MESFGGQIVLRRVYFSVSRTQPAAVSTTIRGSQHSHLKTVRRKTNFQQAADRENVGQSWLPVPSIYLLSHTEMWNLRGFTTKFKKARWWKPQNNNKVRDVHRENERKSKWERLPWRGPVQVAPIRREFIFSLHKERTMCSFDALCD